MVCSQGASRRFDNPDKVSIVNQDIEALKQHVPLQLVVLGKQLLESKIRGPTELNEPRFAGK